MASINFFAPSIPFKVPFPRKTTSWIKAVIKKEKYALRELNIIFCSDDELYQINLDYLKHNTFTDIITFDNSEEKRMIEGDIYISVDRVRENADKYGMDFPIELRRVIIHGVLHLMGYKDKSSGHKKEMRRKEDAYLSLFE
jgi:probable rRNA maturation factor